MSDEIIETPVENQPIESVPVDSAAGAIEEAENPVAEGDVPVTREKPDSPVPAKPVSEPTRAEPIQSESIIPKEEVSVEQIGNKTIEKKGDTVTITEIMEPKITTEPVNFPAPFKQTDLWQKFLDKLNVRKKKRLEKILTALSKENKITNDQVEQLLHVSDATATRYLDQLEREGRIRQVGKTGKYTYYQAL